MIVRETVGDALEASEEMLLVPVPFEDTVVHEGFAKQVFTKHLMARRMFEARAGLNPGDFLVVGDMGGDHLWRPTYSLVLAGIHHRSSHGWKSAPELLENALDRISTFFTPDTIATAGIPGTGYSGLQGDAPIEEIRQVLQESRLQVTVYHAGESGDREGLEYAEPPRSGRESVAEPKQVQLMAVGAN